MAVIHMNPAGHQVISDITGATGMRIIRAMVAGDIGCHSSAETVRQALIGNYASVRAGASHRATKCCDP